MVSNEIILKTLNESISKCVSLKTIKTQINPIVEYVTRNIKNKDKDSYTEFLEYENALKRNKR